MRNDKVLSMIGLAKKAGKISHGAPNCEKAIKSKSSRLIIIAYDISDNGKKAITDCCKYYSVKYIEYSDKYALSDCTGTSGVCTVISVNDDGFAEAILNKYAELQNGRKGE